MAYIAYKPDQVSAGTDKLVQTLLTKAMEEGADIDFQLSVVQAATRWTAVKNRMSVPDEENQFDRFRAALDGTGPAAPPAGSAERAPRQPRATPRGGFATTSSSAA